MSTVPSERAVRADAAGPAQPHSDRAVVTVRYFAAARAATGVSQEVLPAGGRPLTDLLTGLASRHGPGLVRVLGAASFLVDGLAWHDHGAPLPAGATVDVLPPFAGG